MTDIVDEHVVPADAPGEPVVEVRDLRVWYATERGPVRAVDGVSFDLHEGEILGSGGGVGLRQVDPGPGPDRAAARRQRPRRRARGSAASTC